MGAMYKMILETFYFSNILKIAPVKFSCSSIFLSWLQVYTYNGVTQIIGNIVANVTKYLCAPNLYQLCRKLALINASPPVSLGFGVLNICIWPEKANIFKHRVKRLLKTSLIMLVTEVGMERMFLITSMHPLNTNLLKTKDALTIFRSLFHLPSDLN